MDKKTIQGVYRIGANLTGNFPTYNLTGANRNANKNANSVDVNFTILDQAGNLDALFRTQNTHRIKRARIVTNGCEWLRAGLNSFAFVITLVVYDPVNNITGTKYSMLKFLNFNEWNNFNIFFNAFEDDLIKDAEKFVFHLVPQVTNFNIDDFNIQADYIGQPVSFYLEMEIDSAGIYNSNGDLV